MTTILALHVLAATSAAGANERPPVAAAADEPTFEQATPPAPPTAAEPLSDAPWSLYHAAFVALASKDAGRAVMLLDSLVRDYPDHPAARLAGVLLAALGAGDRPPAAEAGLGHSGLARGEVVIFQTLHGIAIGGEVCVLVQCSGARQEVGALSLGGLTALAGSWYVTRDGVRPGQAALTTFGSLWGFWNGVALLATRDTDVDEQTVAAVQLTGQLAGLVAGAGLDGIVGHPSAGQVTLATTTGAWAGILTAYVHAMHNFETSQKTIWWSTLIVSDAALVGGGVLASRYPMSFGRVLVINAVGVVGMLLGMGGVVLVQGDDFDARPFYGAAIAGSLAGLGAGTYLSRDWDAPALPLAMTVLPTPGGAMAALRFAW